MPVDISFVCEDRMHGIIAEPVPANRVIESWFRKLQPDLPDYNTIQNFGRTVKACPPFLDAMTLGWMLLLPIDTKIEVKENGALFTASWRVPGPYVEAHWPDHIAGHPKHGKAIAKVFTMWAIHTPPGWSTLIFPPLNRAELPLEALSGVLDTDTLHTRITIPCFINLPDGVHLLAKGTPLAQVLPFKRESIKATIRAEAEDEGKQRHKQEGLVLSEVGAYQHRIRAKDRGG